MEHIKNHLRLIKRNEMGATGTTGAITPKRPAPAAPPKATCDLCKGRGFVRPSVPFGHPDFGKALPCDCKKLEQKRQAQEDLLKLSGIVGFKRFKNASFETFKKLAGCKEAYRAAQSYANSPYGWLVMLGPYGCGKTHLAVSIARVRVNAGDAVLVQTAPDLLGYLRSGFASNADVSYDERLEQMKNVDMLVIDDFGAQNSTDWATEQFFQLLNHRYNAELATVITSNNMSLEGVDPRIASRLRDRELVTMVVMDQARDFRSHSDREE